MSRSRKRRFPQRSGRSFALVLRRDPGAVRAGPRAVRAQRVQGLFRRNLAARAGVAVRARAGAGVAGPVDTARHSGAGI